jgi:hypothetical protein
VDPARALIVASRARQQFGGDPARERERVGVAGGAMDRQEESADAGRPAALADVVPEARASVFRARRWC